MERKGSIPNIADRPMSLLPFRPLRTFLVPMENYNINEETVTTKLEAVFWISKIWIENPDRTKDEKERKTADVIDQLSRNIIRDVS